jgi:7-carboxy-7-deazaguanine synthase
VSIRGRLLIFIRLGGCDVGCHWCDVKDSWDAGKHPLVSIKNIVQKAAEYPARIAVVTGGEPCMYDLTELTSELHKFGFNVHIETSGAYSLSGELDWICVSPKKFKAPLDEVCAVADELKVIVFNKSDFKWAEEHADKVPPECSLLLQPEWSREKEMLPLMIDYVKQHPKWRISLQTHKYMNVP